MRSCKTVSELTALNKIRTLSVTEKIAIFIHRAICAPCRAYKRQIERLHGELGQVKTEDLLSESELNADARRRILENIQARTREERLDN